MFLFAPHNVARVAMSTASSHCTSSRQSSGCNGCAVQDGLLVHAVAVAAAELRP